MRFFLRTFFLPLIFAASLMTPAHAQTLQLTSIHDVSPGMSLDDGIAALRAAGYVFETSPTGDVSFQESKADHYTGFPVYLRQAQGVLKSEGLMSLLMAVRKPDAPEDEWQIAMVVRGQSFLQSDLMPHFDGMLAQASERIGAPTPSCMLPTPGRLQAMFLFDEDGTFIPGDTESTPCADAEAAANNGEFPTVVMAMGMRESSESNRVTSFMLALSDGDLTGLMTDIRTGTYGKSVPALGDF